MKKGCSEVPAGGGPGETTAAGADRKEKPKPPFRPAKDDTKPLLRDPVRF